MLPAGIAPSAIEDRYRRFGATEVGARSPAWRDLALGAADSGAVMEFVRGLPAEKRQPNLVLSAARLILGRVPDAGDLERLVARDARRLTAEIMARRTQTNEPARCATLLPFLARLPQLLALLEVGAAAGLCLWPDR